MFRRIHCHENKEDEFIKIHVFTFDFCSIIHELKPILKKNENNDEIYYHRRL